MFEKRYYNINDVPAVISRALRENAIYHVEFDAQPEYIEANGDRRKVETLPEANTLSSELKATGREGQHKFLLLDIDLPAALIKSTKNSHLYVELPDSIPTYKLAKFLRAAASIGLVDVGYAEASIFRGFTSLRFPWVRKDQFDAKE